MSTNQPQNMKSTGSGGAPPAEFERPTKLGDLTPYLKLLLAGETLDAQRTAEAFEAIMSGHAHDGEIGALLALLATRTPTADELLGAARVMRAHVDRVESKIDPEQLVDTAGTGGAPKTFNVSTVAALVAAAAGASVAKHGNRSRTGRGSAEVLRHLGVNVDADRATQAKCLEEAGICFCFAIHHHPAAKHAMPVRMALGFPTIFNLLGPLTNPAGARRQLMGVYEPRFLHPIAKALAALGAIRAMVIHSDDGLDELSISAPTRIVHVQNGQITEESVDPQALGLSVAPRESVVARDLDHAARIVREVIEGKDTGPARDMTLLNAAATLLVADKAPSLEQGLQLAAEAIDSGQAANTLRKLVKLSSDTDPN
ncbi:MAG: anthranilate phosphoribosyltransferase [Planctomycetes bacterium]|nr:anthranilate phosphoribosyltransferase [Planctomycetota bacterium]MCH8260964.1 anthranilate phosphoribosyltransferase [Planctomycetota bacterium]